MANKPIKRNVLIDEPTKSDQFYGQGHDRTARALALAIKNANGGDRAIGLDGPWGSGKSSVVEIAEQKLKAEFDTSKIGYHFFTFDIWKAQGSAFRRSFLEHFLDWSKRSFPERKRALNKIESRIKGKVRTVHTTNKSLLDWYGIGALILLPVLPIYYFWAKTFFDQAVQNKKELNFFFSAPAIVLYLMLALTVVRAAWIWAKRDKSEGGALANFQAAVSQTLLISARQYEDQVITQNIREADPNDFEFQETFRDILSLVQKPTSKIVVVLDNIDRLPADEILANWALVRSVFSRGPLSQHSGRHNPIIAVVPYDRSLIAPAAAPVTENDDAKKSNIKSDSISSLRSREIFSKTFDEILAVSPPVMSNSRDFFQTKIASALPNLKDSDELFGAYFIFNHLLKKENEKATPRQIISFINELSGLYVLHEGRFKLPTIAVYIAYQDALERNPTTLTAPTFIDERIRNYANDPQLERNLAAIIYNVDVDLAFQILLDDQIKPAAVAVTSGPLESLVSAPGFDLRVAEVIRANVTEWQNAGDFAHAVKNFADVFEKISTPLRALIGKSLVDAFDQLSHGNQKLDAYRPLLQIYRVCQPDFVDRITDKFVELACASQFNNGSMSEQDGVALVKMLQLIREAASAIRPETDISIAMQKYNVPETATYTLGLAQASLEANIPIEKFNGFNFVVPEDDDLLVSYSAEHPSEAIVAFRKLSQLKLIRPEQWEAIATSGIAGIQERELEDHAVLSQRMNLLFEAYLGAGDGQKRINTAAIFETPEIIYPIHAAFADHAEDEGFGALLALAGEALFDSDQNISDRMAPIADANTEYVDDLNWIAKLLDGMEKLPDATIQSVAQKLKAIPKVAGWIQAGTRRPQNSFISSVVRTAFATGDLPATKLSFVFTYWEYLDLAFADAAPEILKRLAAKSNEKAFGDVELTNIQPNMLVQISAVGDDRWKHFSARVEDLLNAVPADNWESHLTARDNTARILFAATATCGYQTSQPQFREHLTAYTLKVVQGETIPAAGELESALAAIAPEYYQDIVRRVREDAKNVTATSLQVAQLAFPNLLSDIVKGSSDRLSKDAKENVIRQYLCSALEGHNRPMLESFISLKRKRVRDFLKVSEESTRGKLEGCWQTFIKGSSDWEMRKQLDELIHGKRRPKSIIDFVLGTGGEEIEHEDN